MTLPAPAPGLVIAYSYLWRYEHAEGHEDGRKVRPAVIVIATASREEGETDVYVVPITHSAPTNPDAAVEIPPQVRQRLHLDEAPCWAIVNEGNRFCWPGVDLGQAPVKPPSVAYGFLPPKLFAKLRDRFVEIAEAGRVAVVTRTD